MLGSGAAHGGSAAGSIGPEEPTRDSASMLNPTRMPCQPASTGDVRSTIIVSVTAPFATDTQSTHPRRDRSVGAD